MPLEYSPPPPLVEYSSNVRDPYTQKNIKKLEMVQCRAARYVLRMHHNSSSVTVMFKSLNWRSLENRRKDMHLCMMYKIDRGLVAISKDSRLTSQRDRQGTATHKPSRQSPVEQRREECLSSPGL